MMPRYLYRGDSDPKGERQLKSIWPRGFLLTNLANGGSGREIFSAPLVAAVRRHVEGSFEKTHFLSFSESRERAKMFAAGRSHRQLLATDAQPWDSALITIDSRRFTRSDEIESGIYRCLYPGRIPVRDDRLTDENGRISLDAMARLLVNDDQKGRPISVLLVDVVACFKERILSGHHDLEAALEKATQDAEWLILPLDSTPEIRGELTALLDDGCISSFERYRFAG